MYRRDFDVPLVQVWGTQVSTVRCEQPGCDEYARWWRPIEADYACGTHHDAPAARP